MSLNSSRPENLTFGIRFGFGKSGELPSLVLGKAGIQTQSDRDGLDALQTTTDPFGG
jgi:hypothetical protein